jgi:transposase
MRCQMNLAAYVSLIKPHQSTRRRERRDYTRNKLTCRPWTSYLRLHRMPSKKDRKNAKRDALREEGTLNPAPEKVTDPKFRDSEFFDPRDAVQVKYEMLRRVLVEHAAVTAAAEAYGVSRPTFYQTKTSFDDGGVAGLVPKKRGPRGPHKLHSEVVAFLRKHVKPGEPIRARALAWLVRKEFHLDVPARTIERALGNKTPR